MRFNNILGQPVLVQSLKNAINKNMISNAYIFNGPKGCGKMTAAHIFAAAINCINDFEKPCGECFSCRKTILDSNPDVIYIKPAGSSIKIDQIRELISIISKKPYENPYRVVTIENGDKMGHEAQDAFLKTLEEPEGNNVFIILTENFNSLHQTIVSRCQLFNFKSVSNSVMRDYLTKELNYSADEVGFAIEKSSGIIGRAIEILKNDEISTDDVFYDLLSKLLSKKRVSALSFYDDNIKNKEGAISLLDFLLQWFRSILLFRCNKAGSLSPRASRPDLLNEYGKRIKEEDVFAIIDMIKAGIRLTDFNINTKNIVDSIFLKIMEVFDG
jgi:DNA polymerase-3 subunit delta'